MAITYTKESLQKLLDNVDIDKLSKTDGIFRALNACQKQDYKSLLEELGIKKIDFMTPFCLISNDLFYTIINSNKICIKKYNVNCLDHCIACYKDDLNSIRRAVEFLQSLPNIKE